MLISRSEAKLKAVKAELVEQYPSVKVPTPHSHRHSRPTPPSPVVAWRLSPLDNSLSTDPSLAPSRFPRDDSCCAAADADAPARLLQVDYAVADFSKLTPTVLAFLKAKLDPLDIGTLVNNVGVSYDFCQW